MMIQKIEELSLNAWPSLQTIVYDGWILRFAEGYTRRSNSINPIYLSTISIEDKIHKCSVFFQLKLGSHRNRILQQEYSEMGEESFAFEILDTLTPDKENPYRDYSDDLSALKVMWVERLQPFGAKGYNAIEKK